MLETCRGMNETYCKRKFCASSWLITKINILRCTVSKTSKYYNLLCLTDALYIHICVKHFGMAYIKFLTLMLLHGTNSPRILLSVTLYVLYIIFCSYAMLGDAVAFDKLICFLISITLHYLLCETAIKIHMLNS